MKKIYTFLIAALLSIVLLAQPQKISYQAVIRNASNALVINTQIGMRISILQGSATGKAVYVETQTTTTNVNGLATIEIGAGIVVPGTFSGIDWSTGVYFIKTETAIIAPFTTYTITGTSQLLSVPYALYSLKAANGFSGNYSDLINKPSLTNGTVTSVTGTSPIIVATGTNTPVISMVQASGTTNGYLSNNDWTIFNNKSSFNGAWSSLTGKPTTIAGYGITDAFNGTWTSLTGKPTTVEGYGITDAFNGTWASLNGKPSFATVATSGSYADLINKPSLNTGTVTNVTGTSPIVVATGTTTPVISMVQASGTTNGYLSSTNWTTFNNKSSFNGAWSSLTGKPTTIAGYGITDAFNGTWTNLTGKPTTVAGYGITDAFNGTWTSLNGKPSFATVATSGSYSDLINKPSLTTGTVTSVTGTTPIIVTTGTTTPAISIVQASGTTNGYLSSADWTTFNNKSTFDGAWSGLTGKPTTVSGFEITDAVTTTGNQNIAGNKTFSGIVTGTLNANYTVVSNVATPVNAADAVNKAYVDAMKQEIKLEIYAENGVSDIDGNQYKAVKIGNQVWMKENLKTTLYNDGTEIPNISDNTAWAGSSTGAYCDYNNTPANSTTYGRLYNLFAVDNNAGTRVASNGGKNVCPTGWHVPRKAEWITLENYLIANGFNWDGTTSSNKIAKSMASTSGWATDPTEGNIGNDQTSNNRSGFTALPGGLRNYLGGYYYNGSYSCWWSSTEDVPSYFYARHFNFDWNSLGAGNSLKQNGYSVRCLRD